MKSKNTGTLVAGSPLRSSSRTPWLGDLSLNTGWGVIEADEATGMMTAIAEEQGDRPRVIHLITYATESGEQRGPATGQFIQLEPESAREIAASLIKLAAAIDGKGLIQ